MLEEEFKKESDGRTCLLLKKTKAENKGLVFLQGIFSLLQMNK